MGQGVVIVDHTTTSAKVAREMAALASEQRCLFIDAPVSGGQAGAENGQLSVMAGGDPEALARVEPALKAYAKAIQYMGPAGSGQLTKMVNQICIAGTVQGLAEAVAFAQAAGLDTDAALAAVSKGAAQSWQMDNRWKTMARGEFDFGFAVDWMRKDLGLVLDEARANGSSVAVTALVDQFYAEVQAMGGARWDTSSLAARLQR
jgi:3-hydroxyisobutyrate dehydrogenase